MDDSYNTKDQKNSIIPLYSAQSWQPQHCHYLEQHCRPTIYLLAVNDAAMSFYGWLLCFDWETKLHICFSGWLLCSGSFLYLQTAQHLVCSCTKLSTQHSHLENCTDIRGCLVPHKMQNANYFKMMECKMPKFSRLRLVSSKVQNLLPSWELLDALLGSFWPIETKIQNRE